MNAATFTKLREQLLLSQSALAELLGINTRTVRKYEAGDLQIPGPVRVAIAAIAEASPAARKRALEVARGAGS